ncbi:DUF2461 domain-containing protein [Muricauda sp. CAU 1633]|uniref:DUF2461 domain-containing protein n=1 Tax=Allomuricauda sp. CAU 1633 TaxID=2816036 RepID=UPI001A8F84AD|nr:DUF2461 domain-containing protein [Muricauda sp. CAU 1633]MBO0320953.1 DUF2461 domain-containing protein [Muricauda sp. CAU 1633]
MITKEHTHFFKELAQNNNKEWFHQNKKRFENEVKAPFLELLEVLLATLNSWDERIPSDPKKALFRINKDVRFSKDKSPYHTILKAGFSPDGKKSMLPGYYLGVDATSIHVGGGLFMVRPPELALIREHIAKDSSTLEAIVKAPDFTQNFGWLKGEKAKRLDKNLLPAAEKTELIYHKQFYAMAEFPLEPFYESERLEDEILLHFKAIKPLNAYLNQAFD